MTAAQLTYLTELTISEMEEREYERDLDETDKAMLEDLRTWGYEDEYDFVKVYMGVDLEDDSNDF